MALSNIFREPRREITESAVGITVFVLILVVPVTIAWHCANAMVTQDPTVPFLGVLFLVIVIEVLVAVVFTGLAALTHALGERVYNALARKGVELRPKQRR